MRTGSAAKANASSERRGFMLEKKSSLTRDWKIVEKPKMKEKNGKGNKKAT